MTKHVAYLYHHGRKIGIALVPAMSTGWPSIIEVKSAYYALASTHIDLDSEGRYRARYTREVPCIIDDKDVYLR